MRAGLRKNGTRAFVAVTAVCAALSPAALAAVGGVSAQRREDATASRLVRVAPAPVIQAADGVLHAGAPGIAVSYRDAEAPSTSWTVRRGVGDLADDGPIAPDASFRIGSVTKTYLATAVLGAVGEGRLALDDTLARWLPGVLPRLDEGAITVRMLLDHTSGVPDPSPRLLAHPNLFGKGAVTPADLVAKVRHLAPVAAPGKGFSYSNADYWLLAMILERATGQTYTEQIEARVLRPLGLTHTVLPSNTKRGVRVPANPMGVSVYGLGLTKLRLPCGVTLYGNMGGLAGYTTWVQATADGRRTIAVAANTDELPRVDRSIRKVVEAAFCG